MTTTARLGLALALALLPRAAAAQTIWTPLDHRTNVGVEWWHASFRGSRSITTSSGAWFLSVGIPINQDIAFAAELPYGHAAVDQGLFGGPTVSSGTVGNPYLGLRIGAPRQRVSFVAEVGGRFAAASTGDALAEGIALLSEFERFEAFTPRTASLALAGNIAIRRPQSSSRLRVGVVELLPKGAERATYIDYGAQTDVEITPFRFGGALTGRYLASGSNGTFSDRSVHFVTGAASVALGDVRPSFRLRLPIDSDFRDATPWQLALGLELTFR